MKTEYLFMHKNIPCGFLRIDPDDGALEELKIIERDHMPYIGTADLKKMKQWWQNRAIPGGRGNLRHILEKAGCGNTQEFLAKNLALSISDTYWICPVDLDLTWNDVKLYNAETNSIIAFHNMSSYDRNASLGGEMNKYWDMNSNPPVLVKTAGLYHGQQAVNEAFACLIHDRQDTDVPFVKYLTERTEEGDAISQCDAFTTEEKELVPAYEILSAEKKENSRSLYDEYIMLCSNHGIDVREMQKFMDYQTLSDFVISNTDRHLMNFGVLRDPETLKFLGPAPIFDSGNSMFFADGKRRYTRVDILNRKISSIHSREEAMLKHVKHRDILRSDLLPAEQEVMEFFSSHGIPEDKAQVIAANYSIKCELLSDFQNGKRISYYLEKLEENMRK